MHESRPQLARPLLVAHGMWVGLGLLAVLGGGCRNDASQQDAYIRDLRMHEQQIYELQDYMTEYQELLRQQRKENAKLRDQLAARDSGRPSLEEEEPRSLLEGPRSRRATPEPLEADQDLPSVDPGLPSVDPGIPSVDPGIPSVDPGPSDEQGVPLPRTTPEELGPIEELPEGTSQRSRPHPGRLASRDPAVTGASFVDPAAAMPPATAVALYAEQIALEPVPDVAAQEIGLMAIVEPLTETGVAGDFRGDLSLMIVDPIAPKDGDWEIARWDYSAEEVEQAWRNTARRVLDLPLAAPPETPVARPLELWVRLLPADGSERILARTMIELGPPPRMTSLISGGPSARETHVSSRWQAADRPLAPKERETSPAGSWRPSSQVPPTPERQPGQTAQQPPAGELPSWAPRR